MAERPGAGEALAIRRELAYGLSLQQPPPLTKERFEMLSALANQLSRAHGLVPRIYTEDQYGAHKLLAVLMMAHELQLPFMESVQGMYVIEGKVQMSGEMRLALIRGQGHTVQIRDYSDEIVSVYFKRRDTGEDGLFTWTMADARRIKDVKSGRPLAEKPAWQSYPRAMLLWRVVQEASHALFTDLMHGRVWGSPDQVVDDLDPDSGGIAAEDLSGELRQATAAEYEEAKEVMPNGAETSVHRTDKSAGAQGPPDAPAPRGGFSYHDHGKEHLLAGADNAPGEQPHDRPDAAGTGAQPGEQRPGGGGLDGQGGAGRSRSAGPPGPGGPAGDGGLAQRAGPQPGPAGGGGGAPGLGADAPALPALVHLQARVRFYALTLKDHQHRAKGELLPDPDLLAQEAEASLRKLCLREHLRLEEREDLTALAEMLERMGQEAKLELPRLWAEAPA